MTTRMHVLTNWRDLCVGKPFCHGGTPLFTIQEPQRRKVYPQIDPVSHHDLLHSINERKVLALKELEPISNVCGSDSMLRFFLSSVSVTT